MKNNKSKIFTYIALAVLLLTHIATFFLIFISYRYYAIYPALFVSIVILDLCILAIADIIFFVGFNHQDLLLKIVSSILVVLLLIIGVGGSFLVTKTNKVVNNVLNSNESKYETFSGSFVYYDKYNNFTSLHDLASKKVGFLQETSDGLGYIARKQLSNEKLDYGEVEYKTNNELMQALLDNEVDVIAINSAYKTIFGNDENSSFGKYLDNLHDIVTFQEELKIGTSKKNKNISTDPFNVLLIGYSRTDIGSSVGLADSIILATINPQTYTVSMMSIARDSFVPINCYGGSYDKINSGRSTSRACFIDTVQDFLGIDIDYYMELDYLGLVAIVNAIGGIYINNPVEFDLDGIHVPAGDNVFADGQMALQFCRERHHMPNGDFDRQQHQKEVIMAIASKFIQSGDVNLALNAMDAASDWMSTDMSLNQLTTVFNLLLNTKNYTSLPTFDLVDFQTLRMTGYGGIMYYSYSARLPLWVYLIYKGSYDESLGHIKEAMGQYDVVDQDYSFNFDARAPYGRAPLYQTEYPHKFLYEPDPMPPYWADLTGMSIDEAYAWADENGITLDIEYINFGDENYNQDLAGTVVDQSVRYGSLINNVGSYTGYNSGTITVMGLADMSKLVPNFVGHSYLKLKQWAKDHDISYSFDFDTDVEGEVGDVVSQSVKPYSNIDLVEKIKAVVKAKEYQIDFNTHSDKTIKPYILKTGDYMELPEIDGYEDGNNKYIFVGWNTKADGTGEYLEDTSTLSDDATLHAIYSKVRIITLDYGYDNKTDTIYSDESLPTPNREGYEFLGWFNGDTKITSLNNIGSITTLKAKWEEINLPPVPEPQPGGGSSGSDATSNQGSSTPQGDTTTTNGE